ncbi:DUF1330 domain-containing protein [Tibeticola sp.]|jgi:uncharacterized protein (DUF1330 family)|uniref:DUF1330 domain-containing protein n=1 Tax=Tibeticola sp. TaxID=2005368 RepID=UPI00259093E7|nr:DUF1330 domain-containing protein [Tibeticola sp.]MCI4440482.1 DUF1330 domain-containing protein [Tibeticola sp.]
MPSAYVIADVTVTNPEQYAQYRTLSSIAIERHGAEICVRGGATVTLEGDWTPGRIVVLKFPNLAAAQAFYDSPEYRAARAAREGACVMRMIAVEGV